MPGKLLMRVCQLALLLLTLGLPFSVPGLILENEAIRIEVDPQTFSVRFLGWPGGANFVDTVYLTERERNLPGLIMPGGIMTDVLPVGEKNAILRRGPATVVEEREDYVLLLGPENPVNGLQVKKEYMLHRGESRLTYKLSVLSSTRRQRALSVRVTAQVPWESVLEVPKNEMEPVRLVCGAYPGFSAMLEQTDSPYRISLAARSGREGAVLRMPVAQLNVVTPFGVWSRAARLYSAGEGDDTPVELFALIDDRSAMCQVALEGRQEGVNVGAPLVLVESWVLKRSAMPKARKSTVNDRSGSERESS